MFSAWLTPPIVPLLKVYVFNITNGAQVITSHYYPRLYTVLQVLEGADPVTEEIGPYVYSATHIRTVVQVGTVYSTLCIVLYSRLTIRMLIVYHSLAGQTISSSHTYQWVC